VDEYDEEKSGQPHTEGGGASLESVMAALGRESSAHDKAARLIFADEVVRLATVFLRVGKDGRNHLRVEDRCHV
jgi:hypothetical protein